MCELANVKMVLIRFYTNAFMMCFGKDSINKATTKQNTNIKILSRTGNRTRNLSHRSVIRYLETTEKFSVSMKFNLFKYFSVYKIGRNKNKQIQMCGPLYFNKYAQITWQLIVCVNGRDFRTN